jgi:adenylosuccinate lyase
MIPRYKVPEIHDIWKTENKLNTWLRVELAHIDSLMSSITDKTLSEDEYNDIILNVKIDRDRWEEIEKETRHDFQAFVQMLEETVPNNSGRWIHYGLTSSDVLDTSLSLMCQESIKVVMNYCGKALHTLSKRLKSEESNMRILSRTHGKAAEIQRYYDVIYRWLSYLRKGYDSLVEAKTKISVGKMSGASGNYNFSSLQNEANSLRLLGLKSIPSSQIVPRQYYLDYFYGLLQVVLAVEKIAYDIRIYSIDGINEISEPFSLGQKGSSAMPHKKNPILTENICGLTRLFKSYFHTAVENCTTLLERDISHSSSERIIFKDAAHITCFSLNRLDKVFEGMRLHTESAEKHCKKMESLVGSQKEMHENIKKGESRKSSHDIQQSKAVDTLYLETY